MRVCDSYVIDFAIHFDSFQVLFDITCVKFCDHFSYVSKAPVSSSWMNMNASVSKRVFVRNISHKNELMCL